MNPSKLLWHPNGVQTGFGLHAPECFAGPPAITQPRLIRLAAAKAQAPRYLGADDFNAPALCWTGIRHCAGVRPRLGHDLAALHLYGRLHSPTQVATLVHLGD